MIWALLGLWLAQFAAGGKLTGVNVAVTIMSPTSAATYDNGTSTTLNISGTVVSDARISYCSYNDSVGSGLTTLSGNTFSQNNLTVANGTVIIITCTSEVGTTGQDSLTVTVSSGSAFYYTGTLRQPTCSDASIDSAISSSVSGDIVRMASACASFTASISIPSTKGILFDGNGSTFSSTSTFSVQPNATKSTRLTNFTVTCGSSSVGNPTVSFSGSVGQALWRFDHITVAGSSSECFSTNQSSGLIDHFSMRQIGWGDEVFHHNGTGDTNQSTNTFWQDDITPGQSTQVYVEDSYFQTPTSQAGFGDPQSYYGARVVYRYNTFEWAEIDAHGGGSGVAGTRWQEIYKNSFLGNPSSPGGDVDVRAGSGMFWGNTRDSSGMNSFGFCTEGSSPGPVNSQPGRGKNMALDPAYAFLNGQTGSAFSSNHVNACSAVGLCSDCIQFNRDVYTDIDSASCTAGGSCTAGVGTGTTLPTTCTTNTAFWKTDAGGDWDTTHGGANDGALYKCTSTDTWTLFYTPYTYPHPLQTGLEPDK